MQACTLDIQTATWRGVFVILSLTRGDGVRLKGPNVHEPKLLLIHKMCIKVSYRTCSTRPLNQAQKTICPRKGNKRQH